MRVAQVVEFRKPTQIAEIPDPVAGEGEVVIAVEACGMCRSDWHVWNGDWDWMGFQPPLPHIPGHEIGGTIAELGPGVTKLEVGRRVTVPWTLACGGCTWCAQGLTNLCANVRAAGFGFPGAYAAHVAIPNADLNVIPVPEGVDALSASALGCRYMVGFTAVVRQGRTKAGEWVSVVGTGGQGLAAVQVAHAAGARVVAVDIDRRKLDLATAQGADATVLVEDPMAAAAEIKEITGGGAHVSVDCLSRPESMLTSILSLRRKGRHVHAGYTTQPERGMVPVPIDALSLQEIELIGCGVGMPHADFPELLALVAAGRLRPAELVTEQVGLEDVTRVLESMDDFSNVGVTVITRF
jgi:D-arabinose 1-dehydrogenase-like Zn-dependent alcohol dehydrogenase